MFVALVAIVATHSFEPHVARALELQVGKARVVIGLPHVDRIIETACMPMPLAHPLVRGIGFEDERPIVCVVLSGKTGERDPHQVTAVLLAGAGAVTWAVCADQVVGVIPVVERSTTTDPRLPRWLGRVRTSDGRVLAWLEPSVMVADIGGVA